MRAQRFGYCFKPSYTNDKGEKKESQFWSVRYYLKGRRKTYPTKNTDRKVAEKIQLEIYRDIMNGREKKWFGDTEDATLAELYDLVRTDYANKDYRSLSRLENSVRHLTAWFSKQIPPITTQSQVTSIKVSQYIADRRKHGRAE